MDRSRTLYRIEPKKKEDTVKGAYPLTANSSVRDKDLSEEGPCRDARSTIFWKSSFMEAA